jgi:hypothetical protein
MGSRARPTGHRIRFVGRAGLAVESVGRGNRIGVVKSAEPTVHVESWLARCGHHRRDQRRTWHWERPLVDGGLVVLANNLDSKFLMWYDDEVAEDLRR